MAMHAGINKTDPEGFSSWTIKHKCYSRYISAQQCVCARTHGPLRAAYRLKMRLMLTINTLHNEMTLSAGLHRLLWAACCRPARQGLPAEEEDEEEEREPGGAAAVRVLLSSRRQCWMLHPVYLIQVCLRWWVQAAPGLFEGFSRQSKDTLRPLVSL